MMTNKQKNFIEVKWFYTVLLIVGCGLSQLVMAESAVVSPPVSQLNYDALHQGRIQVNVTLFHAPCNLSFQETWSLTGCGAGRDYQQMNLSDVMANTPATVQFYDVQRGVSSSCYPLSLLNGNNLIYLPALVKDKQTLRLEVNYE
ncbi:fimbrial protein [Providencia sp.]|uniref:fimbrial protein n=1 Tax=Providencia sp. TaxID=589 RepID=UPI0025F82A44|nr:fimbrial protein [Providencia sp.]